jgi:hypothetical protein
LIRIPCLSVDDSLAKPSAVRQRCLFAVRKALLIAAAAALLASAAASAHSASATHAIRATQSTASFRYSIVISVVRANLPARLTVRGVSGPGQLFVRARQPSGVEAAAMIDGPFLYERAPNGISVNGSIRWLRVPIEAIGRSSALLNAVRAMTPAPLLRVLGESRAAPVRAGGFAGDVRYDDPIVRTAITRFSGGVEFHDLRVTATLGGDGLIHGIRVTGITADGTTTLDIDARLFAFGRPVHLTPPAEGTFMDAHLVQLAE